MWSDLTQIIQVSPNYSSRLLRKVSRITVHHTAGIASAQGLLNQFANPAREASANYCIGNDGTIGGCVPEEYRAWTSGSRENDTRAITIEVSNDVNGEPWSIGKKAWASAVKLCVDICLRYGFTLWWNPDNKTGSLTCHRWYQATACPGDWFYARIPQFISEVNKKVNEILTRISNLEKKVDALTTRIEKISSKQATDEENIVRLGRGYDQLNERTRAQYNSVEECPDWAQPTVQKLVDEGYLKGEKKGDLALTTDLTRTLVIVDRAGGFDK